MQTWWAEKKRNGGLDIAAELHLTIYQNDVLMSLSDVVGPVLYLHNYTVSVWPVWTGISELTITKQQF